MACEDKLEALVKTVRGNTQAKKRKQPTLGPKIGTKLCPPAYMGISGAGHKVPAMTGPFKLSNQVGKEKDILD